MARARASRGEMGLLSLIVVWWIHLVLAAWTGGSHCVLVASAWTPLRTVVNGGSHPPGDGHPNGSSSFTIRIRRTEAADLPQVAQLLAEASSRGQPGGKSPPWSGFQSKMDRLWAKADIEALLSSRYRVLQEGRKAHARVQRLLGDLDEEERRQYSERDVVRLLWMQASPTFRTHLEKSARETGEDNVWRSHNVQIPPPEASWLRHLQLTAIGCRGEVVGFCEVAVLRNPCHQQEAYTPAIANLATSSSWRRRGVATRLLRTATRYVSLHWTSDQEVSAAEPGPSLGLFVEKDNAAALALYQKLGFEATVTCDGGDQLGKMWYMTKDLGSRTRQAKKVTTSSNHETIRR